MFGNVRPCVLACITFLFTHGLTAQSSKVYAEQFSIDQGLSNRTVRDMTRDQQGFLWIATQNGLNRFDGYDFLRYDSRPRNRHKIPQTNIPEIFTDRAGNLLLTYADRKISILNPLTGENKFVEVEQHRILWKSTTYFQAPDGVIYVAGNLQNASKSIVRLLRFDEQKQQFASVFDIEYGAFTDLPLVRFLKAADGTFWFAHRGFGNFLLTHWDATGHIIGSYERKYVPPPSGNQLPAVQETAQGEIWISMNAEGVFRLNRTTGTFERHAAFPPAYYNFTKDKKGNLLLYAATPTDKKEGCYLAGADGQIRNYNWIYDWQAGIRTVFSDDFTQGLLAASSDGFLNYELRPERFQTFLTKAPGDASSGISIRGIAKLGRDQLYIAAENNGIFELDQKTGKISRPGERFPQLAPLNTLSYPKTLLAQGDSVLWIADLGQVLKYAVRQNTLTVYPTSVSHRGSDEVWGITHGKDGLIWIAVRNGNILQLEPVSGVLTTYANNDGSRPLDKTEATFITCSRNGTIWAGTATAGLIEIDPVKKESRRFSAETNDPAGFDSNHITFIHEDEAGLLWVGTMESGLHVFDPNRGRVIAIYSEENGLRNNTTVGLLPDNKGNYWVSTFSGLSYLDTKLKTFRNYSTQDGLSNNEFNRFSYFFDREYKRFYFGGMNGVNVFDLNDPYSVNNDAPLLISEMSVPGQNDSSIVLYEGILDGSSVVLPPGSPFLHLRLALGNYRHSKDNQFSYKIDGLHNTWIYLGTNRELRIDNLPAGNYQLHLRGADDSGNWSSREIALHLEVQEYWYKRWWAWLFYAFLLAAGGYYFYRFQLRRRLAEKETQRLQQLDAFKNRFFTNITHEFRTPLTVILGMTERIESEGVTPSHPLTHAVSLIKRNGQNLMRLINQILDLAKLESDTLKINYAQGDVLTYLRYITESVHSLANAQNVLLRMESSRSEIVMDYDPERLLQIVHNLLSNAIKFTPSGGRVTLGADLTTFKNLSNLVITVADTGAGIPEADLAKVFDRFYQAGNLEKSKTPGTGIGLSLTRELVKAMGGSIVVESTVGKGTVFTVHLPITNKATTKDAMRWDGRDVMESSGSASLENPASADAGLPTLLLLEDNPDVVEYLIACLNGHYRLEYAYNGRAGIEKALETVPDLIISDVMMPEKDGFEVCDMLKNDTRTSHIPIVLLTARADMESRIAGLRRGADAYLAKPFHREELLLILQNLFGLRSTLREKYVSTALAAESKTGPADVAAVTEDLENEFLLKLRTIIETSLSDPSLDVDTICRKMGMGRTNLYNKLNALTGLSAVMYMRKLRLNKATVLLTTTDMNISEIAYAVGFNDPKFFSRVFGEEFGAPPSELRKI